MLGRRTTWQQLVVVPLVFDNAPLGPGRYRLSAYLPNNGDIAAQTLVEVVPPAPAERQMQGVIGVIQRSRSSLVRVSTQPDRFRTDYVVEPAVGLRIEARKVGVGASTPATIAAVSDVNGTFALALEPGQWNIAPIDPTPVPGSYNVPVTIFAGQWIDKGVLSIVVDDEVPTEDGSSRVSGLVTVGPIDPGGTVAEVKNYVEVPGWGFQDPRTLVPAGPVSIRKGDPAPGTLPFAVWTGVTDEFGRFSATLPPGSYIVDVRLAGAEPAGPFGTGRASFLVKEGRTVRVRPDIDTGIR